MFQNDSNYLDQHFLIDDVIINKFIKICNLNNDDTVVEIGPGKGVLTKKIIPQVKSLTLIEKDTRLKEYLDKLNVKVIYANILEVDIPKCNKIITALPYSIIEPFIYKLINTDCNEIYMIMGSTYVNNCLNKEITNLSLLTNTYFEIEKYFDIAKECFYPMPKTLSSVIKLTKKKKFTSLDLIFKNLYELDNKKIKNALMEAFININGITKKESIILVNNLNLKNELLEKKFSTISNIELKGLYKKISLNVKD